MDEILNHFPGLTDLQKRRFERMGPLYESWNGKINVVSRKDIDRLYTRHILHSLAVAKLVEFTPGTAVLDVGCGGGFPGIPLAVLFPEVRFTLVDSIGKKITVVRDVAEQLNLENVTAVHGRAEGLTGSFDFVVTRAVARMDTLIGWVWDKIRKGNGCPLPNGIVALKGGDLNEELEETRKPYVVHDVDDFFGDPFYERKKLVYIPKK